MSMRSCAEEQQKVRRFKEIAAGRRSRRTPTPSTFGAIAAVAVLVMDQASKAAFFANVLPGEELALAPLLSILPGWNQGTAFGFAQGTAPLFPIALTLLVSEWLAALIIRSTSRLEEAGLGAAIGGALANVADRLHFGAVRVGLLALGKSAATRFSVFPIDCTPELNMTGAISGASSRAAPGELGEMRYSRWQ